jgi:hypothetical protein
MSVKMPFHLEDPGSIHFQGHLGHHQNFVSFDFQSKLPVC